MQEMGKAMMGTGEASGDNRALEAAQKAIANPLLDGVSMQGAKGVIISITGGDDMRLLEVDEAANHIRDLVDPDANIIWGSAFNPELEGKIRVSVVATGIEAEARPATGTPAAEPTRSFSFARKADEPVTFPSRRRDRHTGCCAFVSRAGSSRYLARPRTTTRSTCRVPMRSPPRPMRSPRSADAAADELVLGVGNDRAAGTADVFGRPVRRYTGRGRRRHRCPHPPPTIWAGRVAAGCRRAAMPPNPRPPRPR